MAIVIVGGGIAGLVSAWYLSRNGKEVVLIEKDSSLGGLLNSSKHGEDVYEHGTHILQKLVDPEINQFLFEKVENSDEWNKGNKLNVGVFFNGILDYEGPCIDARNLDADKYKSGIVSLIDAMQNDTVYKNLEEQLILTYGDVFGTEIFKCASEKLFGVDAKTLIPNANLLFMSPRIKVFTQDTTSELKKLAFFDDRIAHHSNQSESPWFYSKKLGVKHWIDLIVQEITQYNTKIYTNESIDYFHKEHNEVKAVHLLNSDLTIDCEHLIWAAPVGNLALQLGYKLTERPNIRRIKLFHFKFNSTFQLKNDVHYIVNVDNRYQSFRITFYGPLTGEENNRCTVEVLYTNQCIASKDDIVQELKKMNIVSLHAQLINSYEEEVIQGFPILSHNFVTEQKNVVNEIESKWSNIILLGRKVGQSFFMKDVMKEAYYKSKSMVASE